MSQSSFWVSALSCELCVDGVPLVASPNDQRMCARLQAEHRMAGVTCDSVSGCATTCGLRATASCTPAVRACAVRLRGMYDVACFKLADERYIPRNSYISIKNSGRSLHAPATTVDARASRSPHPRAHTRNTATAQGTGDTRDSRVGPMIPSPTKLNHKYSCTEPTGNREIQSGIPTAVR